MSKLTVKGAVSGRDINNLLEANNENQTGAADAYYKLKEYEDLEDAENTKARMRMINEGCKISDLYKETELDQCLDIIRTVKKKSVVDEIEAIKKQGRSGMSWSFMNSIIRDFCDGEDEFLAQLDE